ncbi:PilZ domain-containing protein [Kaarinaea lacus]
MSIEYSEKREYFRMNTNSAMTIKPEGSNEVYQGICINLSANGVLFTSNQRFDPGSIIHINITPAKAVVAPLDAVVEVVRTQVDSEKGYAIAGQIKQIS